jgi:hypothetical protein
MERVCSRTAGVSQHLSRDTSFASWQWRNTGVFVCLRGATRLVLVSCLVLAMSSTLASWLSAADVLEHERVCRPLLEEARSLELGGAGLFKWTCSSGEKPGSGYYIVFVRPSGTYVLLKVPEGKTSFEFTPDAEGRWRWIVINTDTDRTKPDVESEPGHFDVTPVPARTE